MKVLISDKQDEAVDTAHLDHQAGSVDPTTARDKTPGKQPGCGMNFFSNILGSNKSKESAAAANNAQGGTQAGGDSR